jgi:arylsulfatase A-like enzyme
MFRNTTPMAVRSCAALAATLIACTTAHGAEAKRPNILLIIADDVGIDVTTNMYPGLVDSLLKQYGPTGRNHPQYAQIKGRPASTPNLDAFANAGMRFTQAWVEPFCANTRSSILSGLYPASTGVFDYTGYLTQAHHSFVRDLKDKGGYSTAIFGKWHIAGLNPAGGDPKAAYPGMKPKEAGFDLFLGNMNGAVSTYWNYEYHVQDAASPASQFRTEQAPTRSLPGIAASTYTPVVNAADAIAWINEQEKKDPNKPWFTWLAFNLAHITEQQQPNPMAVPNLDTLDEPSRREMQACGGTFGSANTGSCTDKQLMRAMTNSMDTIIGKVLQAVDAIDPNTYVIYLGDNGTWMFGAKREFIDNLYITRQGRGKGTAYESGARVEFAVRGPGIKAGTVNTEMIDGVDLFPTILQLAGLPVPKNVPDREGKAMVELDGVSLTPLLLKGARQVRDPDQGFLLTQTTNPIRQNMKHVGARNARYKVLCAEKTETAACEFYDLREDPLEEYPLAKPASCANGKWTTKNPEWHFCRLQDIIATKSLLAPKKN